MLIKQAAVLLHSMALLGQVSMVLLSLVLCVTMSVCILHCYYHRVQVVIIAFVHLQGRLGSSKVEA